MQVLCTHGQFMHLQVLHKALGQKIMVTVVYGSNKLVERKVLWDQLCSLGSITAPWLVGGDFNNVLRPGERQGGSSVQLYEEVDMQQCLQQCALVDMRWQGLQFTWCNKQRLDRRVYSKIDPVLVNDEWIRK